MRMVQHFVYCYDHPLNTHLAPKLPVDMPPEILIYRWFAKEYGFTPTQVDELPVDFVEWAPLIEEATNIATSDIQERRTN